MLEGTFVLLIIFTNQPLGTYWNPYGPFEFSSYEDCVQAGNLVATFIRDEYKITCSSKDTGEVNAEWIAGK